MEILPSAGNSSFSATPNTFDSCALPSVSVSPVFAAGSAVPSILDSATGSTTPGPPRL
eukprot:CAMPEP_0174748382 /NCGR_PEP_ID=MMETSP1094-20130205/93337_1 /TAXON_ID=156173 /ORGANISM="Chrysochromulina brevifilum, Strain UTEX LB 985" /LENGTH=57 /DNA_ID=CAMNT_0015953405 /DNA_START=585 /DNA_END=755 /DNA_ORIENTATION=-